MAENKDVLLGRERGLTDMPLKFKDENGNAAIESVFIVTTTVMAVCALIIIGFVFYQQTVIQSVANDTANKIANTYSYRCKDPDLGYISSEEVASPDYLYRLKEVGSFSSYQNVSGKAKWYGTARLNMFRLLQRDPSKGTKITAEVKTSGVSSCFRRECVVTVEESYAPPIIKFFMDDNKVTFKASGCAMIPDYLEFFSEVNFMVDFENALLVQTGLEKVAKNGSGIISSTTEVTSEMLVAVINAVKGLIGKL